MRLLLSALMAITLAVGGAAFAPEASATKIRIGGEIKGNPPGTGPSRTTTAPRSILRSRTNPNLSAERERAGFSDPNARARRTDA